MVLSWCCHGVGEGSDLGVKRPSTETSRNIAALKIARAVTGSALVIKIDSKYN